ncbi:LssY C-terminal domain-containing protein [Phyllobacterium chamaecytisi]|uniref:LssY C-terminal domain-containing protein n=1 Tax=Phyllobacterium chamaecytisi TaxID=2876082 RepID=UPI001CC9275B|nr:LssY C-terminal domain-containing protein [Phyllobacterium sp. KW56]MBZ9602073.1 LssY C-terminal domain-containing protein [Phyllobacterium sp. KW56]
MRRLFVGAAIIVAVYLLLAYVALPTVWTHYERQPGLANHPMVTKTARGIPGDPLNVGLIGDREDIIRAMHAGAWYPADPVTLRSSIDIIGSVMLDRPYDKAPVSPLFYDGRREDLAYEMPVGSSAKQRHHVRLWKVLDTGVEQRPVWLGSATFDQRVGFSEYTGQVTHDIAPDIDAERDYFANSLTGAGMVDAIYQVSGVGPTLNGRNGEGSPYYTDGEIRMLTLVHDGLRRSQPPEILASPPLIQAKDNAWMTIKDALGN